jgi:hypothetical protein
MNSLLFKAWLGAVISLLSSLVPTWLIQENATALKPMSSVVVRVAPIPVTPQVASSQKHTSVNVEKASQPAFLYSFSGVAMEREMPVANAKMALWITTPWGHELHEFQTAADGSYNLTLPIYAKANEPVDWEIRGQTSDLKTIDRIGRKIAMGGEKLVSIHNTLNFIAD